MSIALAAACATCSFSQAIDPSKRPSGILTVTAARSANWSPTYNRIVSENAATGDHRLIYVEFRQLIFTFADRSPRECPVRFPRGNPMPNRVDKGRTVTAPTANHKTRRDALCFLASAGALGLPQQSPLSAIRDPVLAAIERHEVAWAALGPLCSAIDEVAAARRGREVAEADRTAHARASAVADQTLDALLTTPPLTVEG